MHDPQSFKNFLQEVVVPSTPEDQKDSIFFSLKDWVESGFVGIPSTEVQQKVDESITVWLNGFDNAFLFADMLCEILPIETVIQVVAITAKYAVEKAWDKISDPKSMERISIVEKWLKNKDSVSFEELHSMASGDRAVTKYLLLAVLHTRDADEYSKDDEYDEEARKENAQASIESALEYISLAANMAAKITSHKEICEIIVNNLPKFRYEDLLQWGYFSK